MIKHEPKYIEVEGIMRACYDSFLKTGNKAYSEIIALADAVPAADVVEVVRCRECVHRPTTDGERYGFDVEFPDDVCPLQCEDGYYSHMPDDDWYCADGERDE